MAKREMDRTHQDYAVLWGHYGGYGIFIRSSADSDLQYGIKLVAVRSSDTTRATVDASGAQLGFNETWDIESGKIYDNNIYDLYLKSPSMTSLSSLKQKGAMIQAFKPINDLNGWNPGGVYTQQGYTPAYYVRDEETGRSGLLDKAAMSNRNQKLAVIMEKAVEIRNGKPVIVWMRSKYLIDTSHGNSTQPKFVSSEFVSDEKKGLNIDSKELEDPLVKYRFIKNAGKRDQGSMGRWTNI